MLSFQVSGVRNDEQRQLKPDLLFLQARGLTASGQTHLNLNTRRTLHDGVHLFPTD
jgi:hypothetical protein